MTYGSLKNLVTGLLIGDNVIPKDDAVFKSLLAYAYSMIADKAEALHLLTLNKKDNINRFATGEFLMRNPEMPTEDASELDIDEELCFAVARYIASMLSKEKTAMHQKYGDDIILKYNGKVYQILENLTKEPEVKT